MISCFTETIRNFAEYQQYLATRGLQLQAQRAYEQGLWSGRSEFLVSGFCVACNRTTSLKVDLNWGDGIRPNWRERLECSCGLSNRIRAALDFLRIAAPEQDSPSIYITEQVTALYNQLRKYYPQVVGSEFLRDGTLPGQTNSRGIRHEDLTQLSLGDASVDVILSFDVLEHVPDFRAALREIARTLKPEGHLIASFPFDANAPRTVVRASISSDGTIVHHLPPEYHGDPIDNSGCLCFQVFGWDILEEMKTAGFVDAHTTFYWSADRGYLGPNQLLIFGRK